MAENTHKWALAREHALPSLVGWLRMLAAQPAWAFRLLKARADFFATRKLNGCMATPDKFVIESGNELVSYWSFFVERECWTHEVMAALASQPGPLILDVGANAGLFTHLIWTQKPDARFIVFEPLPRMAGKIAAWQGRTGANVVLHQKAVSDYCGTAVFHASEDNDPTASLKLAGDKNLKLTVPVVTLDSIIPNGPILLIKIDVEGCECEVLTGAKQTLERTRFLILEAHTQEALEKIQKQLRPGWQARRVGASDYFFRRAK